jgi:hypothetical protein
MVVAPVEPTKYGSWIRAERPTAAGLAVAAELAIVQLAIADELTAATISKPKNWLLSNWPLPTN